MLVDLGNISYFKLVFMKKENYSISEILEAIENLKTNNSKKNEKVINKNDKKILILDKMLDKNNKIKELKV